MKRIPLSPFSRWALLASVIVTFLLALLALLSDYMIEAGREPLHYYILTRQIRRQIPILFLSGMPIVFLSDIFIKKRMPQ